LVPGALALGIATVTGGLAAPATAGASTTAVAPGAQIDVGVISSRTGPLAGYFGGLAPGMIAYFKTIDAKGGVDGHKIVITANLDDGGSPSQFTQLTHTLIDQDHVFAAAVSSAWFTPNYFVATKTPTYGYNVSANWQNSPNLFAVGGSTQIYKSANSTYSWFLKKVKAKSVAFISYGPSIASSYDACSAYAKAMKQAGYNVYDDVSAQLGGSYSSDVQRIQQAGSQVIVTCMQASDDVTLSRDVQQYGLKVKQLWLNGYDQSLLNQYGNLMQGVYFDITGIVPFYAGSASKYGNTYPGMKTYLASMKKYEPSYVLNGLSLQGWQSAALLAAGIKAAGSNITQASVISATNQLTNFNANGLSTPVNWKVAHVGYTTPNCSAWVQVKGKNYVPIFAPGKQVFVCVNPSVSNPQVVTPPAGTPGA
jgi:ABC-type branched-subunit amino acid transport system substrate-binding protein